MTVFFEGSLDASQVRVAVVVSRFNDLVTERLLAGALACLDRGTARGRRTGPRSGAWELPLAPTRRPIREVDAVVALGALGAATRLT